MNVSERTINPSFLTRCSGQMIGPWWLEPSLRASMQAGRQSRPEGEESHRGFGK